MITRLRAPLETAANTVALAGGCALSAIALLTVGAVISEAFGAPFLGDSEIVELVVGASVASFLPLCQLAGGHVAITLFTDRLPRPIRLACDVVASGLMLVVAIILIWRTGVGGLDAFSRERATMFLQLPLWWGFFASFLPCLLWVLCAAFVMVERACGATPRPSETPA